jgi:N-acetyltransferase
MDGNILYGNLIRMEPLDFHHAEGMKKAAASDIQLYQWSPVPQGAEAVKKYIETALAWRDAGSAEPYAIVRISDGTFQGSTRFFNMERWEWPEGHPRYGWEFPDAVEIGYSWLHANAVRTGVNTEAKLLLLTRAFETWKAFRVCFHADMRNARSKTAIERLGARFEGTLRAHRMAQDLIPRDSARYSILDSDWPQVKARLESYLNNHKKTGPGDHFPAV